MEIKISFKVTDEQYKDYEAILEDFLFQLNESFIYNIKIQELEE